MNDYTIHLHLHLPYSDSNISLKVQADSWSTADELAEALASLLPSKGVYFDKEDKQIESHWSGYAESIE